MDVFREKTNLWNTSKIGALLEDSISSSISGNHLNALSNAIRALNGSNLDNQYNDYIYATNILNQIFIACYTSKMDDLIKTIDIKTKSDFQNNLSSNQSILVKSFFDFINNYYLQNEEINKKSSIIINQMFELIVPQNSQLNEHTNNKIINNIQTIINDLCQIPYPSPNLVTKRWRKISIGSAKIAASLDNAYCIVLYGMYFGQFRPMSHELSELDIQVIYYFYEKIKLSGLIDRLGIPPLGESELALPRSIKEISGIAYSINSIAQLDEFYNIMARLPAQENLSIILEIGSGYGGLARQFKSTKSKIKYILVDLPESLIFSYSFLQLNFPNAVFKFITELSEFSRIADSKYDFLLCPMQLFPNVKWPKIDLLINLYSLGEMPQDCIDMFMHGINNNINCKYVFSQNAVFQEKNLLREASGDTLEGSDLVMQFNTSWQVINTTFTSSGANEGKLTNKPFYRNFCSVLMRSVSSQTPDDQRIDETLKSANQAEPGTINRIIDLYFAALWSKNDIIISQFLSELESFLKNAECASVSSYDFEKIGEVQYFKRLTNKSIIPSNVFDNPDDQTESE